MAQYSAHGGLFSSRFPVQRIDIIDGELVCSVVTLMTR